MKYEVRYEDNHDGGEIAMVYADGKPIQDEIEDLLNEQAEEIATLKAALNASNAALAEAKKLIREVADNDVSIFKNMSDAMQLVASWDSAVAATTQDKSE